MGASGPVGRLPEQEQVDNAYQDTPDSCEDGDAIVPYGEGLPLWSDLPLMLRYGAFDDCE